MKTATGLRKLVRELKALPNHTDEDRARLDDAARKIKIAVRHAVDRTELLYNCAAQAERIDESLAEQRRQAKIAEKHDDVASRLDAALYGAGRGTEVPASDTADKVMALVAAYREIRGDLNDDRSDEPPMRPGGDETRHRADDSASWGVLAPVNRAWHWAFG